MVSIKAASLALVAFIISACSKQGTSIGEGGALDASAPAVASTVAPAEEPPTPASPKAVLEEHRKEMARAAVDGRYADVCKGTPWATSPIAFNKTLCAWVAARAEGKEAFSVEWWRFPGSSLYRGLFNTEHWAHVHGHLLDDHPDQDGRHEVTAVGYKNHCLLETTDTKYTSKGAFDLWVQEQPEAEEVTTNSGAIQHWILLEEMPLAKALMDLAHSRVSVESTATAKDAMVMIAEYQSYAERKGELPVLSPAATAAPSASAPIAVAAPAPSASAWVQVPPGSAPSSVATAAPEVLPGGWRVVPTAQPVPTQAAAATTGERPVVTGPAPAKTTGQGSGVQIAPRVDDPALRAKARAACIQKCVATCNDDAACERGCAGKCPPG